jgi:PAS domain S-box-containing protein
VTGLRDLAGTRPASEAGSALRELAAIVESSDDAIIGKTLSGVITSWNRGAERMYGYAAEEALGRNIAMLAPPERPDEMAEILHRLARGERIEHFETVRVRKDGTRLDVSLTVSPILAADGTVTGASAIARDITDRKRAERRTAELLEAERAALAEAEAGRERLAFLAEASTALAESLDYERTLARLADLATARIADWCVIEMVGDDGALRLLALAHHDPERLGRARELQARFPAGAVRTKGAARVVRTGLAELYTEVSDELLEAAAPDEESLEFLRALGIASAMVVPLAAGGRTLGAITFVSSDPSRRYGAADLALAEELAGNAALAVDNARLFAETERLNEDLEARVADRTAELEESNRELEAFSYSVSHDLRAPLRAIDGFSRILLKDHGEGMDPQAREYLGIVREGAQQMGRLIDDLLAFSRLGRQPLSTREVDPAEIVRRVLDQLRPELEGREVDVRVLDLPTCRADPALLQQVYANLLANAVKFTRTRAPAVIEVGAERQPDGTVAYHVRDNGVGFDMRYADKLFGVFQRMHRAEDYEGTGVGLAIVQRVVHRHGGRVWAEAEPGVGATFFFTLQEAAVDG